MRPAASSAAIGAKTSRPWNVALGRRQLQAPERLGRQTAYLRTRRRVDDVGEQPVVGSQEHVLVRGDDQDAARTADAGVDDRDMNAAGRKVAKRARQPETSLRRPVREDLVREVDDAHGGVTHHQLPFHDADERVARTEIGRQRHDSAGTECCRLGHPLPRNR
jgi:hypothetical protein